MHDQTLDGPTPTPALRDVPAQRACLRCQAPFPSEGFGERVCKRCKGTGAWRNAVAVTDSQGRGSRARTSGSGA